MGQCYPHLWWFFWLDQPLPCLRIKDLAILLKRALLQAGILFSFTKLWLLRFLMFILVSKLCETSGRLTFVFIISSWVHWPWQAWPLPKCPGIKKHEMKCHSHWRPCGPCFKFITWLSIWLNLFLYLLDLYEKEKDKEGLKRRWCLCGNSGLVKYIHVARPTIHRLPLSVQGNATGNCRNVLCGA